jgi:hypothetical protein
MLWWLSTHKKFPGTNVAELEEENLWKHSMVIGHQPSTLVGLWLKTHIVISSISMYKIYVGFPRGTRPLAHDTHCVR